MLYIGIISVAITFEGNFSCQVKFKSLVSSAERISRYDRLAEIALPKASYKIAITLTSGTVKREPLWIVAESVGIVSSFFNFTSETKTFGFHFNILL